MLELPELYKKLDQYHKNFDDWRNVENFVSTAEEIAEKNDPASIPVLLRYFDDNDNTDYVYERLKGIIESYDTLEYTNGIVQNLHSMLPHAKGWAADLIVVLFNSPSDLEIFRRNLHIANKEKLFEVLDVIYNRTVKHRPLINELKRILEEND